ncbi:cellulose binding domain-containing protein [Umezawaea endophytica]|uniref:Cellulose binding domain-containing protein n=1 Tax=Umezawaea endophytica TaxID=1654476 RepID=A0A9X2VFF3_9PSEU|nr:cellulose binding domain-containing protein [Umezawaea endophytica]MCS7475641.1 cellulose binding domain-containing protein [Umezawaea endophytica]
MRTRLTVLPALVLLAAQLAVPRAGAEADPGVTVAVNARAGLETVSDTAVGANHAIWDTTLGTPEVADLMKGAGVQALRYPGGSYSDIYHWRDHTAPGGYVAPNTDFDHFMAGVRRAGAKPIVTANYGTGTPQEAADWVRYANVEKRYGVRYWEIGNELYGNGHYGSAWEADDHPEKTPAEYATIVKQYAEAMKAVDPTIKVGAVLTTPGDWPDGIVAAGDAGTWNEVVLSIAGPVVDFGIVHWYPTGSTGPESLSKTNRIADFVRMTREQATRYAHKDLPIALTEVNTSYGMNTQPGALFAADAFATLLENGVFTVDWWNVHNGPTSFSTIAGQPDYADFGLLSSAGCLADGTICQPALNTPFAPYHALAMTSRFAGPGDQLVQAAASDPLVKVHASRKRDGGLAVLLVNQDPDAAKPVTLDYTGYTPAASARVLSYTNGATGITTTTGGSATVTLPPYSLTTLTLRPKASTAAPSTPARPTAAAVTDREATLTWTPTSPGVKYEVHRQVGTTTEQWGETTGTSFTVHNLTPGTRYTVNLIARDNAGRVSWSSPPATFTTTTPPTSTCAVTFTDTNDWGNGYVGAVDITNTGTTSLDTWTLAFTWPTTWQQVTSGWNATWTQTGTAVQVAGTAPLAPGATANTGFVGAYQGPNAPPTTFTLNGTLCTTR